MTHYLHHLVSGTCSSVDCSICVAPTCTYDLAVQEPLQCECCGDRIEDEAITYNGEVLCGGCYDNIKEEELAEQEDMQVGVAGAMG